MKTIVVGLGIQGNKRAAIVGQDLVATVDPINPKADFKRVEDIALKNFDSALVCTPDEVKFELLEYLLKNGKHVLVEKPLLFPENAQIEILEKLAKEKKVTCYTAYNHRFEPHIASLKKIIDEKTLGKVYLTKLFYGNGTARDVRNSSWRDKGAGVLPDLGSHLLDMVLFLFENQGIEGRKFKRWSFNCFENKAYDHFIFGSDGLPSLQLEATLLSWRNTFRLDIFAENGSAHIDSLCKWGPTTLTIRKRKLPSGKPDQESIVFECPDPTWAIEYDYFKDLCKTGGTNLKNDLWINTVLNGLAVE